MRKLSAGKAWEDTAAFVARNGKLAFAVALAFIALPQILATPFLPVIQPGAQPTPEQLTGAIPALLIVTLIGLVGSLAIYALVLRPGLSVAEALRHAFGRLAPGLGVAIVVGLIGLLVILPAVGVVSSATRGGLPNPLLALLFLVAIPVVIYFFLRLSLAQVAVADGAGVGEALRRSWRMTRGNVLRLFAVFAVVVVVAVVVSFAIQAIFGSILYLLGGALGGQGVSSFLVAILSSIVSALLTAVVLVLVAQIYRQLEGDTAGA